MKFFADLFFKSSILSKMGKEIWMNAMYYKHMANISCCKAVAVSPTQKVFLIKFMCRRNPIRNSSDYLMVGKTIYNLLLDLPNLVKF